MTLDLCGIIDYSRVVMITQLRPLVLMALLAPISAVGGDMVIEWELSPAFPGAIVESIVQYWDCTHEMTVPVQVSVPYPANSWVHTGLESGREMCYRVATADSEGVRTQWTGIAWGIVDRPFNNGTPKPPSSLKIIG
jgi:hypothetical protein